MPDGCCTVEWGGQCRLRFGESEVIRQALPTRQPVVSLSSSSGRSAKRQVGRERENAGSEILREIRTNASTRTSRDFEERRRNGQTRPEFLGDWRFVFLRREPVSGKFAPNTIAANATAFSARCVAGNRLTARFRASQPQGRRARETTPTGDTGVAHHEPLVFRARPPTASAIDRNGSFSICRANRPAIT